MGNEAQAVAAACQIGLTQLRGCMGCSGAVDRESGSGSTPLLATSNSQRDGFADNPTVFGRILDGTLGATIVHETETELAFADISPASDTHILIIPKARHRHVGELTPADLGVLRRLVSVAETVARQRGITDLASARASGSVSLGFHTWPFISVYHLHLHLIFPAPVTKNCWKRLKFPVVPVSWYVSPEAVAERYCDAPL